MQEAAAKKKRPHQLSMDGIDYDEEEEYAGTLTAQLAETAVGVREMSKQLGAFASFLPLKAPIYHGASLYVVSHNCKSNRARTSNF